MSNGNYYILLGVAQDADAATIRKAYHRLALQYHPDRNTDSASAEKFRLISEAYQVLSDPEKRRSYDLPLNKVYESYDRTKVLVAFLEAQINRIAVKMNEEVELIYVFGPEGRLFKKPELQGWFLAGGPYVNHQIVSRSGQMVRETRLRYIICPMRTGVLLIPPASIRYINTPLFSNELKITATKNVCYFRKGESAGNYPVRMYLHKEQISSKAEYAKVILQQHTVLIPRSDIATWYHKVGRIVKMSMTICGAAYAILNGESIILGILAGSLLGGFNCHIMYAVMGIHSRFYYAAHFPLVQEYMEDGFLVGREPYQGFIGGERWNFLKNLFY